MEQQVFAPLGLVAVAITVFSGAGAFGVASAAVLKQASRAPVGQHTPGAAAQRAVQDCFVVPVGRTFPLANIAEAHRAGEAHEVRGKIVLLVGDVFRDEEQQ